MYNFVKRQKYKRKLKIIIAKGSLEHVVADGWELDNELKKIRGFNQVIDLIDHFSKVLMSDLL